MKKVVAKALKDSGFRKALLSDARAALEQEFKLKLPPSLKVKVLEDTADTVHLVLPPPDLEKGRLTDAELRSAAGGAGETNQGFWTSCCHMKTWYDCP